MARCAFCGRPTKPYIMIGAEAVGPKCAQRAGLAKAKPPKGSRITFIGKTASEPKAPIPVTMDLFEGLDDGTAD